MSFNLAQFRRDQLNVDQYLSDVADYSIIDVEATTGSEAIKFLDKAIELNSSIQNGHNYYLRVKIYQISNFNNNNVDQQIEVTLETENEANDESQYIDNFVIPYKRNIREYSVFEMIISPNSSFDLIKFTLQRNATDYLSPHTDDQYYGRTMQIQVEVLAEITNILGRSYVSNGRTITIPESLTKIGIQGPPGLLMCINGEGIRIGPSGIYEINSGYTVNFMGYILRLSDQKDREGLPEYDYFIMDYQY